MLLTTPKKKMRFIERKLDSGMGVAVARRTYLRRIADKSTGKEHWESWSEVADRVATGNISLIPKGQKKHRDEEWAVLRKHIANGSILMSGRHLQHGDETQFKRNMEVFTNCSTASSSYILFYLLMNGSGVGRAYDDDMCLVDWDNMPSVRCVISDTHPDFEWGRDESVRDAVHKYGKENGVQWFEVPDSREGWAQAIEMVEVMAYERKWKNEMLVLDFSKVREKG
ncbi:MAG TPA: hypothetical protein PKX78_00205, partial [Candidatus Woesebacteria bacterium]|nr:hypothetical protein [Candidatus Woesebacteria bacterium]